MTAFVFIISMLFIVGVGYLIAIEVKKKFYAPKDSEIEEEQTEEDDKQQNDYIEEEETVKESVDMVSEDENSKKAVDNND